VDASTPFCRVAELSFDIIPPPPTAPLTFTPTSTSSSIPTEALASLPSDQFQFVPSVVEKPTPFVSLTPIVFMLPIETLCVWSHDWFQFSSYERLRVSSIASLYSTSRPASPPGMHPDTGTAVSTSATWTLPL